MRTDVAVIGSGFAGSLVARILARQGWSVVVVERGRHPRFALGESSTPLGNLCLERLARRWDLPELAELARWGTWRRRHPDLGVGLKRGFSFYRIRPGEPFHDDRENRDRLLVAASPTDDVADTHWLREDVDAFLVAGARRDGVEVLEGIELSGLGGAAGRWRLEGTTADGTVEIRAAVILDASGGGGFLERHLPAAGKATVAPLGTSLVYAHFDGVAPLTETLRGVGAGVGDPYPEERAAVHHLLDEGWVYSLRFDDGRVSAGAVLESRRASELLDGGAVRAWEALLDRYPALAELFGGATPRTPLTLVPRLGHRRPRAAGPGWALLPHTLAFFDPLFSTGIAWSLVGVERLADVFESGRADGAAGGALARGLERYGARLEMEADHLGRLQGGAWRAMADFEVFAAYSQLYFVAASWCETVQRLLDPAEMPLPAAWQGFLGADDDRLTAALAAAGDRLDAAPSDPSGFAAQVARRVEERNVAGLCHPDRRRLYRVDLDALRAAAPRLRLSRAELERRIGAGRLGF